LSVSLTIIVIRDISYNVPTILFGSDSFKTCLATLAYTGNVNDPTPEFLVRIPRQIIVPITQTFPQGIFTCTANYNLQPYETKDTGIRYSLYAIRYTLFAIRYSLYTICYTLFAIRYSLFAIRCSLFL
jgi:hypothetical protein